MFILNRKKSNLDDSDADLDYVLPEENPDENE